MSIVVLKNGFILIGDIHVLMTFINLLLTFEKFVNNLFILVCMIGIIRLSLQMVFVVASLMYVSGAFLLACCSHIEV